MTILSNKSVRLGRVSLGMVLGAAVWAGAGMSPLTSAARAQAPVTTFTVKGVVRVPGASPTAPAVPKSGVPVALIPTANLGTIVATGSGLRTAVSNAKGEYTLTGVPAGTYFIGPFTPGVLFRAQAGTASVIAPAILTLRGNFTVDFLRAGVDSSNPTLTITRPTAGANTSAPPFATGMLVDPVSGNPPTSGGTLGVAAALYQTVAGQTKVFNWRTAAFEAPRPPAGGTNPLLNADYYRVQLLVGRPYTPPNKTTPTEVRGAFLIALPRLANGSYRLAMGGIDGSLRRSALVSREFTVGTTPPPTPNDTTPPSSTIAKVGSTAVTGGTPQNPTSVSSFASVSGTATDAGSGVASVRLYVLKDLKVNSLFPTFNATVKFWNGTSFVTKTLTPGIKISDMPFATTTVTASADAKTATWLRNAGLPKESGDYGLLSVAYDKAGNKTQPDQLNGISELLALQNAIRTIRFSAPSNPSS